MSNYHPLIQRNLFTSQIQDSHEYYFLYSYYGLHYHDSSIDILVMVSRFYHYNFPIGNCFPKFSYDYHSTAFWNNGGTTILDFCWCRPLLLWYQSDVEWWHCLCWGRQSSLSRHFQSLSFGVCSLHLVGISFCFLQSYCLLGYYITVTIDNRLQCKILQHTPYTWHRLIDVNMSCEPVSQCSLRVLVPAFCNRFHEITDFLKVSWSSKASPLEAITNVSTFSDGVHW